MVESIWSDIQRVASVGGSSGGGERLGYSGGYGTNGELEIQHEVSNIVPPENE